MKRTFYTLFLCLWGLFLQQAVAYDQETHRQLSASAAQQSALTLSTDNILADFGLDTDITSVSQQSFPNSKGQPLSIIELIQDGADFEDNGIRSVQHFYDPDNDQSLQHPSLNVFGGTNKSPDWALEDTGTIGGQDYSYTNAVDYLRKALTSATNIERDSYWGKTFETLGHVIHHIQDMAQPEHTRNDLHCSAIVPCGVPGAVIGLYDKSLFEERSRDVFENGIPSSLINYPAVSFPTAREFWTTRATDPFAARRGIADFTNRNFISKDTNFEIINGSLSPNSKYNLPVPGPTSKIDLATLLPDNDLGASVCQQLNQNGPIDLPPNAPCEIEFISNTVTDSYDSSQSGTNQRAASLSLFDQYLQEYNVNSVLVEDGDAFHIIDVDRLITVNEFNVDASHNFLIPRAVAYSAGLTDHFFRGRLDVGRGTDMGNLQFTITNISGSANTLKNGIFEIYYEAVDGTRKLLTLLDDPTVDGTGLAHNASRILTAIDPADRNTNSDVQFVTVFKGTIGSDEGIAAKVSERFWEPFGDTLTENHPWEIFTYGASPRGTYRQDVGVRVENGVGILDTDSAELYLPNTYIYTFIWLEGQNLAPYGKLEMRIRLVLTEPRPDPIFAWKGVILLGSTGGRDDAINIYRDFGPYCPSAPFAPPPGSVFVGEDWQTITLNLGAPEDTLSYFYVEVDDYQGSHVTSAGGPNCNVSTSYSASNDRAKLEIDYIHLIK